MMIEKDNTEGTNGNFAVNIELPQLGIVLAPHA